VIVRVYVKVSATERERGACVLRVCVKVIARKKKRGRERGGGIRLRDESKKVDAVSVRSN